MKASSLRRFFGYMVDLLIIGIVVVLLYKLVPTPSNSLELQSKLNSLNDAVFSDEIVLNDYLKDYVDIMYQLDKGKIIYYIVDFASIFVYFIIIPFITKGKTLGNLLMKTRIKSKNDSEPSLFSLIIRNFIINGLGYLMLQIIFVNTLDSNRYFYLLTIFGFIQILLVIISVFMVKCRKDKRGLHDILGGTIVIDER